MLRRVRAVIAEILGLFVSDWVSSVGIAVVLAAGWALARSNHGGAAGFAIAAALAGLLVVQAAAEARRSRSAAGGEGG
jgi:hypothetical protein